MHWLADLLVVDTTTGIAGAYASKLFADAGAEVVKVEPPGGDPLRRWSATTTVPEDEDGALFRFLHTSKRSLVAAPGDAALADLLAGADLVFEDGALDVEALRAADPRLVVVSITGYGRSGPWADRPWTDFTVQAASGCTVYRGTPERPPFQAGGRVAEWTSGSFAGTAALAAVLHARRTGGGAHVDCSMTEVMAIAGSTFSDTMHSMVGRPSIEGTVARNVESPSIEPAADGWVGFNTNAGAMFQQLLLLIERPDLLGDPELSNGSWRIQHLEEWHAILHAWTTKHPVAEIVELAAELRVPTAPVCNGQTVLDNEHLVARGAFVANPAGFRQPRPPYLIDGEGPGPMAPAPALGDGGQLPARTRPAPPDPGAAGALPYAGRRIFDMTSWWAGPGATGFLALLGAEVIHLESTAHPDGMRATGFVFGRPNWWEWSHMFAPVNTNKLGITLDLSTPRGLELAHQLIATCDAVVENFSPRVTEHWGLTWEQVQSLNPRAVFMRMPAFGLSGPWRDRVGFAQTMEQLSGMAWVTGERGGPPTIMRGPPDPIAAMHGAFALMLALDSAQRTGRGHFVEAAMIEAALNCAAEQVVEFSAYGNVLDREGNRSPHAAPQGLYACRGVERWVAISVVDDDQWARLRTALGDPSWAGDPTLATHAGRRAGHDLLDDRLSAWAADRELADAVDVLVAHGVPACEGWDPRIESQHPQLVARRLYEEVEHPDTGVHPLPGHPFRWTGNDQWLRSPAPRLGEHNRQVFGGILGLTDAELADLEAAGIIGTEPG